MPRLYHYKNVPFDVEAVFIGRPTKWGNPFSHKEGIRAEYIVASREEAVAKYEEWIKSQPNLLLAVKKELRGQDLSCYCFPALCHGFVLLKIANED